MPATQDHLENSNKPSDYRSKIDFDRQVNVYLQNMRVLKLMPNLFGLIIFLGFVNSTLFFKWIEKNKQFEQCLLRARDLLHEAGIQILCKPDLKNGNGLKAYMSKAFGYSDKMDINSIETTKVIRLPAKKTVGAPIKIPSKKKKRSNFKKKKG